MKVVAYMITAIVVIFLTAQLAKNAGYNKAIDEIEEIGAYAHSRAMKAPWIHNDFYAHPHNSINTVVVGEVDESIHNPDMRWDTLSVVIGNRTYLITAEKGKYKKGDKISVYLQLNYEPVSMIRAETIFSVAEMRVD